jgi:hypothetical protein
VSQRHHDPAGACHGADGLAGCVGVWLPLCCGRGVPAPWGAPLADTPQPRPAALAGRPPARGAWRWTWRWAAATRRAASWRWLLLLLLLPLLLCSELLGAPVLPQGQPAAATCAVACWLPQVGATETTDPRLQTIPKCLGGPALERYPCAAATHQIFGPESSGKTTLALHAIAEVQQRGGVACLIDVEHAFDPGYAQVTRAQRPALPPPPPLPPPPSSAAPAGALLLAPCCCCSCRLAPRCCSGCIPRLEAPVHGFLCPAAAQHCTCSSSILSAGSSS